jgi:cell division protein FtsI (penicillin-binding protein 3)
MKPDARSDRSVRAVRAARAARLAAATRISTRTSTRPSPGPPSSRPKSSRPKSSRPKSGQSRRAGPNHPPANAATRRRLLILLAGLVGLFGLIAAKVTDLQVINPGHYLSFGQAQTVRSQTLAADRGTIYDRNRTELAMSVPMKTIFADPKLVADASGRSDAAHSAALLAPILGLDVSDLTQKLSGSNRFVYLARKVSKDISDKVAALKLPGIDFLDETDRITPGGGVGRSLIGTVDPDNNGLSGLEKQYASELTGTPGSLMLERNPQGHTIPVGEHQLTPAVKGDDLVLTIDRSMQYQTEQILADQVHAAGAKGGIAIVTRPSTGEVLAMANVATDPKTGAVSTSSNNAAVTTIYEPGSVMKMATVSAAIEQGLVTPNTTFSVPGTYQVGDHTFSDAEPHGTETLSVAQILAQSSNIGTIKIAQQLGRQGVYDTLTNFGFGAETGLAFLNEAGGRVLQPGKWSGTSMGTIPIGQGVSATALQVLEGYNSIANGGVYVGPRLVDSTIDANGNEHPIPADSGRRVVSATTASTMNMMLRGVVTGGTGTLAKVDGYTVFGKTGTARKPQAGGVYTDKNGLTQYESTFVGAVPAEAPALSVIVVIDEPSGGNYYGGAVAAPAFSKIASYGLQRFSVPPPVTDGTAVGATLATTPVTSTGAAATDGVLQLPNGKVRAATAGFPLATTPATGGTGSTGGGATAGGSGSTSATIPNQKTTTSSTPGKAGASSPPTTRKP